MASYHLDVSIIGRSQGRSAIACAAYRAGVVLADPETGRTQDYRRKRGVVASWIEAPDGAPEWATDRQALWSAVQAKETRSNSRLAREIRIALPHELDDEQRAELVRSWVRDQITARGIAADIAIHAPGVKGDNRNHHAHIMVTLRRFDLSRKDGWDKSAARDLNETAWLETLRETWAEAQNTALERAGETVRVDHRSLADQRAEALAAGDELLACVLDRPAEPRAGLAATHIDRKAGQVVSDRGMALAAAREHRSRLMAAFDLARRAARVMRKALDQTTAPSFLAGARATDAAARPLPWASFEHEPDDDPAPG